MFIAAIICTFVLLFFLFAIVLGVASHGAPANYITGWALVVSACITFLLVYFNVI